MELSRKIALDEDVTDILPHALGGEVAVVAHHLQVLGNVCDTRVQTFGDVRNAALFVFEHKTENPYPRRVSGQAEQARFFRHRFIREEFLIFGVPFPEHANIIVLN